MAGYPIFSHWFYHLYVIINYSARNIKKTVFEKYSRIYHFVCPYKYTYRCVVSHGNPEKMFPSNVLISLEAEKNPLSLIKNPRKSPFRNFFYDHSKVELFSFLCSNFYKKILSITRQRKDATAVAQLTLILNARVSYHKCHTHTGA